MTNATTAQAMYALNINQTADLIGTIGRDITVVVQGNMGTGKSSIINILADRFPNHKPVYLLHNASRFG